MNIIKSVIHREGQILRPSSCFNTLFPLQSRAALTLLLVELFPLACIHWIHYFWKVFGRIIYSDGIKCLKNCVRGHNKEEEEEEEVLYKEFVLFCPPPHEKTQSFRSDENLVAGEESEMMLPPCCVKMLKFKHTQMVHKAKASPGAAASIFNDAREFIIIVMYNNQIY